MVVLILKLFLRSAILDSQSACFKPPVSSEELEQFENDLVSDGSRKKWEWALKMYTDWAIHRNNLTRHFYSDPPILKELEDMTDSELDYNLSRFVSETRSAMARNFLAKH